MSRNDPNRNRVFIGHLNPDARTRDLEKFFRDHGFNHVKDVNIKLGYAFVEFEDKRDADDAVYELDKKNFFGSRITVEHAKGTPREDDGGRERRPYRSDGYRGDRGGYRDKGRGGGGGHTRPYNTVWRIIVNNLSSRVGWHELKDFFRAAGEVTYTKANKERVGEGVVEFKTYKEMQRALQKFDGAEFFDRKLKLVDDSPGPPRSRSRSRGRRSHSRSRSGSMNRSNRHSSKKESKSRSRSNSPKSHSRSRSRSPAEEAKSVSRSRSKSQSPQQSPQQSPTTNGDE